MLYGQAAAESKLNYSVSLAIDWSPDPTWTLAEGTIGTVISLCTVSAWIRITVLRELHLVFLSKHKLKLAIPGPVVCKRDCCAHQSIAAKSQSCKTLQRPTLRGQWALQNGCKQSVTIRQSCILLSNLTRPWFRFVTKHRLEKRRLHANWRLPCQHSA